MSSTFKPLVPKTPPPTAPRPVTPIEEMSIEDQKRAARLRIDLKKAALKRQEESMPKALAKLADATAKPDRERSDSPASKDSNGWQ